MLITRFRRIDTVTWPGQYLSVVDIADGEGDGENFNEVANTIRGDRDSIDAILILASDGDAGAIPGVHRLIREIRPPHMPVILVTAGTDPAAIDDLVGAGYVDRVAFRLESRPDHAQLRSMEIVSQNRAKFVVGVVLDPGRMEPDDVLATAEWTAGHDEFILLMPKPPAPAYRKKDLNALAKSLKGKARNVRVLDDFRTRRDRARRPGSGTCCSR